MNPADFSSLTDAMPEPMLLLSTDSTVLAANLVATRSLGRARDSLIGTPLTDCIADDPSPFMAYVSSASGSRQLLPGKIKIQKLDGTVSEFRTDAAAVLAPDSITTTGVMLRLRTTELGFGGFGALNKTIRELTEEVKARRKIEADLLEAKMVAEGANRAKSEFLANMSHEIRTPMTAILGYSDLLIDPTFSASARQEAIQAISRNGNHLLAIVDDLLDIAKIEAEKLAITVESISPNELIADVVSLMRVRAITKGLSLSVSYGFPFPSTIQTDINRLRQILLNVIGNAIKFTDTGSIRITARVNTDNAGNPLLIVDVADTGRGIDTEAQKTIFKPFVQVDSSMSRQFGGTGLGLAICKNLAQMLGGDITLKSLPNRGSTFSISVSIGSVDAASFYSEMSEITTTHAAPMAPAHRGFAPPEITAGLHREQVPTHQTQAPQPPTQIPHGHHQTPANVPLQAHPAPPAPTQPAQIQPPQPHQPQMQAASMLPTEPPAHPIQNSPTPPSAGPYPQMSITSPQGPTAADQNPTQDLYTQYQTPLMVPSQTAQPNEPAPPVYAPTPQAPLQQQTPLPTNAKLRGRVLLAEDGPDNQRILMLHLSEAGLDVEIVEDGLAAVETINKSIETGHLFDILLLDMQMPRMDGYTAARTLREQGIQIPIVAVTAHAMTGDREKCLGAGCDDYISKPFTRENLIAVVSEHLLRAQAAGTSNAA